MNAPPRPRRAALFSPPAVDRLQRALLDWFATAQRPLPWRDGYDPYKVWVSEMMLQQTQVETVKPYFARWMARLPDVRALAEAPLGEVLKLWEGLGYYARARNLHRAAQAIVAQYGGAIPGDLDSLRALPGIGPYSAGAIASIAFNAPTPLVDGNVARVLSRLYALDETPQSPAGKRRLWELAESLVPPDGGRDFNQALMELGALICRGQQPLCGLCPVREHCVAHAQGNPDAYPIKKRRAERPLVNATLVIAQRREQVLLRQRPPQGLWGGLWELPWIESGSASGKKGRPRSASQPLAELLAQLGLEKSTNARRIGLVQHGLTHRLYEWTCYVVTIRGRRAPPDGALRWVNPEELHGLPLGRPMHKVIELWRRGETEG